MIVNIHFCEKKFVFYHPYFVQKENYILDNQFKKMISFFNNLLNCHVIIKGF